MLPAPRHFQPIAATMAACTLVLAAPPAAALVVADFNNTGFDFTFAGFEQTPGPTQVRLFDPVDGWGGAGIGYANPLDFTANLNEYLQVDYTVQPGHNTGQLVLEFYDTADRSIKFGVPTPTTTAGTPQSFTVRNPFSAPEDGIGDFANFDYANVDRFQVLGEFGSPEPFDVSIDRVQFTPTAPPPYGGFEPDAPWRAEATQRIDQNRKADLTIDLRRPDGAPIADAQVRVVQQEHDFGFGSAVVGHRLVRSNAPDDVTYRNRVEELFNMVTLENTLKWPALEGEFGNQFSESIALDALDWATANGIESRGHAIVWPGNNNLPQSIIALDNDPAAQRQAVLDHVRDLAAKTQGKVVDWDVVNEPRTNRDLLDRFGDAVMDEWFDAADANNDARLFLNEFNIITGNFGNQSSRDLYLQQIQGLQQRGVPIDGIGMQGHFRSSDLTDIEQVWAILDGFHDATGLPITITEFDFTTEDEQLQADYLRDFMTAVFAHEGVHDFVMWGFWEGAHWRPDAALFRQDWSIKPAGEAFINLVFDEWWTDLADATDAAGTLATRVFHGTHRVEVEVDGKVRIYDIEVGPDGFMLEDVFVAELAGDFNGNGTVEQGDLDLVLTNWGGEHGEWSNVADFSSSTVDQEELDAVLTNWGSSATPSFDGSNIPESAGLVAVAVLTLAGSHRPRAQASSVAQTAS